ncbi:MAG: DnaJ domain-containing protein [Betaproteobacteria bacterium]|nr:DnaJ domain-containing protein [Betaproteobacteria bacterium]
MDYYDILEVPENANAIWIRRAYDRKVLALEADHLLTDRERQRQMAALEVAFKTLSYPAARERYDNRRRGSTGAPVAGPTRSWSMPGWIWGLAAIVLFMAAAHSWQQSRESERLRVEQEQVLAAQAAQAQEGAVMDAARNNAVRATGAQIETEQANHQRHRADWDRRAWDSRYVRQDASQRADYIRTEQLVAQSEQWARQLAANERMDMERQRRQAIAETERQIRLMEQQQREERAAFERQDQAARAEQRRIELQERMEQLRREAEERRARSGR